MSVTAAHEHDLLRVKGKINGRKAVMLIDSGSTHDFIAGSFVNQSALPTEDYTGENLCQIG